MWTFVFVFTIVGIVPVLVLEYVHRRIHKK